MLFEAKKNKNYLSNHTKFVYSCLKYEKGEKLVLKCIFYIATFFILAPLHVLWDEGVKEWRELF